MAQQALPTTERRSPLPIGPRVEAVLKVAYQARKPVLLEGPSGIGKSEIVAHAARALGIGYQVLDLSLLEPPDLVGLPVLSDGLTRYARPSSLPGGDAGILMLEELNRAERHVQHPALQLLSARCLHEYVLPEGWSVVAAINPEDGDYHVTALDPALRGRFLQLHVCADRSSWLTWARANRVHPAVLRLALVHDHLLDEVSPRTWKHVSDVLRALAASAAGDEPLLRDALAGYLPGVWIEALLEARSSLVEIDGLEAQRLLAIYAHDADAQARLAGLRAEGRTDCLDTLTHRLESLLLDDAEVAALVSRRELDLASFERLLADLPGDHAESLQDAFGASAAIAPLLKVGPEQVLDGYRGNAAAKTVEHWLSRRSTRHLGWALATAVMLHLARTTSPSTLRRNSRARDGLACLLAQLGPEAGAPLRRAIERLDIPLRDVEKRA